MSYPILESISCNTRIVVVRVYLKALDITSEYLFEIYQDVFDSNITDYLDSIC